MLLFRGLVLCLLVLGACGEGVGTLDEVDPDAAPLNPTWSEHISGIMEERCAACHAEDSPVGETEGYGYGTCEKVKQPGNWNGLVETGLEKKNMPPGGADKITPAEALAIERWWEQGATCD